MKDNTFQLLRHIWNDVSEDWPFYTEEERQSFRRRKPQNLTPPGSDGSTGSSISSGHSSSSSHPASPQPPSSLKRPGGGGGFYDGSGPSLSGPVPKKMRVSNYMRPPDLSVGGKSPLVSRSPSQNGRSPLNESNGRGVMDSNDGKVSGWLMLNGGRSGASPSAHKFNGGSVITPASSPDSQDSSSETHTAPPDMEIDQRNAKDYLVQFTPIVNSEQRRIYKAEFNKNYNLYQKYHRYLEGVSRKFTQLENQLRQEQEGSDTWKVRNFFPIFPLHSFESADLAKQSSRLNETRDRCYDFENIFSEKSACLIVDTVFVFAGSDLL
jgi:RNA polymerase II elongation factor ELL